MRRRDCAAMIHVKFAGQDQAAAATIGVAQHSSSQEVNKPGSQTRVCKQAQPSICTERHAKTYTTQHQNGAPQEENHTC